jgi:hypothetical protein
MKQKLERENNIKNHQYTKENTHKWITFTYVGQETKQIARMFKDTNTKITFRTTNTIQKHLQPKQHENNEYGSSSIYRLKCMDCPYNT